MLVEGEEASKVLLPALIFFQIKHYEKHLFSRHSPSSSWPLLMFENLIFSKHHIVSRSHNSFVVDNWHSSFEINFYLNTTVYTCIYHQMLHTQKIRSWKSNSKPSIWRFCLTDIVIYYLNHCLQNSFTIRLEIFREYWPPYCCVCSKVRQVSYKRKVSSKWKGSPYQRKPE